jgi:hypothetical protein
MIPWGPAGAAGLYSRSHFSEFAPEYSGSIVPPESGPLCRVKESRACRFRCGAMPSETAAPIGPTAWKRWGFRFSG